MMARHFYSQSSIPEPSPQLETVELVRGPAPIGKGEGPRGRELSGLCSTQIPCVHQSADKAATVEVMTCS